MWPNFDLKTIMLVIDGIKKQIEINLISNIASQLICHNSNTPIENAVIQAKEIVNKAKTIVGA
jgi:hypothetical protein